MPVIAVVGNKGGAGKTTVAVNLAAALGLRAPTVLLDADPQGSALQWRAVSGREDGVPVLEAEEEEGLRRQIDGLLREYGHVVIDCPPAVDSAHTNLALRVADLALIPAQPSPVDLWATAHIEQAVEQARSHNISLRSLLVINQLEPRTILSRVVREALADIAIPVANSALRRRAIYRASALEGKTVYDVGRRGAAATAEFDDLVQEVLAE